VPGIGPSPDKMLQGRLFAYGDAQRYRLGVNHTHLPVNRPHATEAANYGRDGGMRFDGNGGRSANYEPNSVDGPAQTGSALASGVALSGTTGTYANPSHAEDDDFVQAGNLYRTMSEAERERLVENIAGSMAQVTRPALIEMSVEHFRAADPEYGQRVADAVKQLKSL
jgi:catalase